MNVYEINDCEWWMAPSLEEAKEGFRKEYGWMPDSELEEARQLTEEELDDLTFIEDMHNKPESPRRTFREELARRVALGHGTGFFATTET